MAIKYLDAKRIRGSSTGVANTTLTFNSSGTFTPAAGATVNYVVVGGGGGGAKDAHDGGSRGAGGGGAGAYRESGVTSSDTAFTSAAEEYTITIGTGGAGGTGAQADGTDVNGDDGVASSINSSSLSIITADGGGFGGGHAGGNYTGHANGNASGGGGSNEAAPGAAGTYGNAGGAASNNQSPWSGSGGGGAGAAGQAGSDGNGGDGGIGRTPSTTYFSQSILAGGGAGRGGTTDGDGGSGIGGDASASGVTGGAGTANTGSGGGATRMATGGAGGTGIVIISFPVGTSYSTTGSPTVGSAGSQDEKATLVTTAATKNAGWTQTGSTVAVVDDVGIDIDTAGTSGTNKVRRLIGTTLSNTAWVCRFKLNHKDSGGAESPILALSANNTTGNDFWDDAIMVYANSSGSNPAALGASYYTSGGGSNGISTAITLTDATVYYVELIRTASDNVTISVFTGSDYSTGQVGSTQAINSSNITGIDDLITIQAGLGTTNGARDIDVVIQEIKIYNGVTSATGTPVYETNFSTSSDLPENTLFEETDTRSIWWLQDNQWKGEEVTFDLTTDPTWQTVGSGQTYSSGNDRLDYQFSSSGMGSFDMLGKTISDTKFRLRFRWTSTSQSNYAGGNGTFGYIGLIDDVDNISSISSTSGTPIWSGTYNFAGFVWGVNHFGGSYLNAFGLSYGTNNKLREPGAWNGSAGGAQTNLINNQTTFTYYMQIERTSATQLIFSMFTNDAYTGTPAYTSTRTITAGELNDLRRFIIVTSASSGNLAGYIDDIVIRNGW